LKGGWNIRLLRQAVLRVLHRRCSVTP
jgi:hypothetical protein